MKRYLLLTICIVALASTANAQGSEEYNKLEVYGGYSIGRASQRSHRLSLNVRPCLTQP